MSEQKPETFADFIESIPWKASQFIGCYDPGDDELCLDGYFTAAQLRVIADGMDKTDETGKTTAK